MIGFFQSILRQTFLHVFTRIVWVFLPPVPGTPALAIRMLFSISPTRLTHITSIVGASLPKASLCLTCPFALIEDRCHYLSGFPHQYRQGFPFLQMTTLGRFVT